VYRPSTPGIGAKFEASDPLLLAGLKRAAALVGIGEVPDSEADLALRTKGVGTRHRVLDIACEGDAVVITLTRQPPLTSWLVLFELIGHLTMGETDEVSQGEN
jgi:hypothetical protein